MKHPETHIEINKIDTSFRVDNWENTKLWLSYIAKEEGCVVGFLNYSLVNDNALLELNKERLKHDYYTDIITFDLSDKPKIIEGDIYISADRVVENAQTFHVKRMDEMRRVMAHGLLHLLKYEDKTKAQKVVMREKEQFYLNEFNTRYIKRKRNDV